jgi:hypothetical protein
MNHIAWTKRKAVIALLLCVIMAVSSVMFLQNNQTTQAAIISPPSPPPGLVGWWHFDEGAGSLAIDSSTNGNNGTIHSATWISGKIGNALSFNGINSYIEVPDSSSLNFGTNTNFTISCWLNTAQSGIYQYFLAKDYGLPGYWDFFIDSSNVLRFASADGHPSLIGTTILADGNWHYVTVVGVRNGKVQLYVDGVADGAPQNMVGGSMSSNAPLRVGSTNGGGGIYKGSIDEISIYTRALLPAEIQTAFQSSQYFSSQITAKIPKGTTQVIITLTWQGEGSINVTTTSPSQSYTEDMIPIYQKTTFSTTSGISAMLNIKRLSISVNATSSDQIWTIGLAFDGVNAYQASVEVQK